mgnify:CR=1 FL=1
MKDNAIVNLPLAKRPGGCINAQLDRYKREKAVAERAIAKSRANERRHQKAQARYLLKLHLPAMIAKYSPKFGTPSDLKRRFERMATWEANKLISLIEKFLQERSRAADGKEGAK